MKTYNELPDGYLEIDSVTIREKKSLNLILSIISIIIIVLMIVIMNKFNPITSFFSSQHGLFRFAIRFFLLWIILMVNLYIHELIHALSMKFLGAKSLKFGAGKLFSYVWCDCYFEKLSYIIVLLSPIVIFGLIVCILNIFVPSDWFWIIWFMQICNIITSVSDLYVVIYLLRIKGNILILDEGLQRKIYKYKIDSIN